MARGYAQYAPYRPALTAEQQSRLDAASGAEKSRLYKEFAMEAATAQVEGFGTVNHWLSAGRRDVGRSDALPEDEEICVRFPEVDPRGKYSEMDMRLAQRRGVIDAACRARGSALTDLALRELFDSDRVRTLEYEVDQLARRQRILTRASKLCHDEKAAEELRGEANALYAEDAAVKMELVLDGVEYLLGIREGKLPKDVDAYFRDVLDFELTQERIEEARPNGYLPEFLRPKDEEKGPRELPIVFPSMDAKLRQLQFARPQNWGKAPEEYIAPSADMAESLIGPGAGGAATRALDSLYGLLERASTVGSGPDAHSELDRYHYLVIDGRPAIDVLTEHFATGKTYFSNFDTFLLVEAKQVVGEHVAAALTQGRRVDAFVPDHWGNIPDEPLRLTTRGFEPSHMKPVELNAWERFWSRFGRYKNKVAQVNEYQKLAAARERVRESAAWSRLQLLSGESQNMKAVYFGERMGANLTRPLPHEKLPWSRDMLSVANVDGTDWVGLATMKMLADGHRLEDVMDPGKLKAEKAAAGREVIELYGGPASERTLEKLDTLHNGAAALAREIKRYAAEQKLDLSDPKTYTSEAFVPVAAACLHAYAAGQVTASAFGAANTRDDLLRLGTLGRVVETIHYGRESICTGGARKAEDLTDALSDYLQGTETLKAFCASRGKDELYPGEAWRSVRAAVKDCPAVTELAQRCGGAPRQDDKTLAAYDRLRDAVRSGELSAHTALQKSADGKSAVAIDTARLFPAPQKAAAPQAPTL